MQEAPSLCWKHPLEHEMAPHSRIHTWNIPWTEEPGRLLPTGSCPVGHDLATKEQCQQNISKHYDRSTQWVEVLKVAVWGGGPEASTSLAWRLWSGARAEWEGPPGAAPPPWRAALSLLSWGASACPLAGFHAEGQTAALRARWPRRRPLYRPCRASLCAASSPCPHSSERGLTTAVRPAVDCRGD